MPSGGYPPSARRCDVFVVELQSQSRRAAHSRLTDDLCSIFAPGEVLVPILRSRIEERHIGACFWINSVNLCALKTVTERTSQPEVFGDRLSAEYKRNDMLDMQPYSHDVLGAKAIAATIARRCRDAPSQFRRDIRLTHDSVGIGNGCGTECPRAINSATASARRSTWRPHSAINAFNSRC